MASYRNEKGKWKKYKGFQEETKIIKKKYLKLTNYCKEQNFRQNLII